MNNLIGLTGKAGSGKDAVARILVEDYGYTRIAFADAIRDVLESLDPLVGDPCGARLSDALDDNDQDWDVVKRYPEVRRLLQNLGTAIREISPGFWINAACIPNQGFYRLVVSDVRLPSEVHEIQRKGGVVYRVVRSNQEDTGDHPTERALDHWGFPLIGNDGTMEQLKTTVREAMAQ